MRLPDLVDNRLGPRESVVDQGDGEVAGAVLPRGTAVVCGMAVADRGPSHEPALTVVQLRQLSGVATGGPRELPGRW
ncbi:hypothetical protein GA0115260_1015611 [Streptomyces sp. MnatMP-M27]|nr:hypothetical protein GA0115260_1015611 [Streptomyces sp. MnatMP-M27]